MEHDPKSKQPEDDAGQGQAISESKMRQALGIDARGADRHVNQSHNGGSGGGNAQRRRFVNDGDVPVVMIGRRREHASADRPDHAAALSDRVMAVEQQLASEREARIRAETQLSEARHTIQNLQAKVAHADLARDEAVAHAQRALNERGEALRELQEALRTPPPEPEPKPTPPQKAAPVAAEPVVAAPVAAEPVVAGPRRPAIALAEIPGGDVPAFTAQILSAYLARNRVPPAELPALAESVMHALVAVGPHGDR